MSNEPESQAPVPATPSPEISGWEAVLENLDLGVFSVDNTTGSFIRANAAMARMFGYPSAADLIGASVHDHYTDPSEREETFARLSNNPEFIRTGVIRFEATRTRKDTGKPFQVLQTLTPVFGPDRRIVRIDGTAEELSARQKAEQVFRQGDARFRVLFDTSAVGMALTDPARRVTRANDAFCGLVGRTEEELRSVAFADLVAGGDPVPEMPPVAGVAAAQDGGREHRFSRPDGESVWGLASWTWLHDDGGNPHSGVVMVQDISDRKRMEEALLRMEKLESLGVLAGGIAHDFNNILAAVIGYLSLASSCMDNPGRLGDHLERAQQAALRARDLTHQFITFAKGGTPVKEVASIADVVRQAADLSVRGTSIVVRFDVAADLRLAEFDAGQMSQVCHNLFINAIQAMPRGGTIRVTIANAQIDPMDRVPLAQGAYVRVDVADEGVGIPDKHLGRIFDPYFSTKENGSGLGLATAHSIVRRHGGHIGARSTLDKGCTFTFFLPATKSHAAIALGTGQAEEPLPAGRRILFMDDDGPVRRVAEAILSSNGFEVATAADGETALEVWRMARAAGRPFNLAILDLTVRGGMGGVETLARLRQDDPAIRAVVTSGYSDDPILSDPAAHGFLGVLPKPFTRSEIVAVIRRALEAGD